MSVWGKKKFVDVVAETKDKEVTTRPPPVSKPAPSAEPKEDKEKTTAPKEDNKEKSVNEDKNTDSSKKRSPDKIKSSNGKGGKRDAALSVQEQGKNMSHSKEEPPVVPKKEIVFGTVKGAGAWGNNLLVDKIKEKTAEEEAAAAAAAANKKYRLREKTDIVKESPEGEKIEEVQGDIRIGEIGDIRPAQIVEVGGEEQEKKEEEAEAITPMAEHTPKSKEGKNGGGNHKDEGPTELVPIEDSVIVPLHHDPQPPAEQPPVVQPPVVKFPDGISLPTNMEYMFEGFLYTPKQAKPAAPRSPPAPPIGMTASPAPMAMSPATGHATTASSREYTGIQQPISNMKSNVALPSQHQRFNNYGPAAPNWNGNISNHMGNRYTSDYNGHQQRTGFTGPPQNQQQQQFTNIRNYNMPLAHGQPMRSSHHQAVAYPNASQSSYTNSGYNRPIRRNNVGMVNIPRPNNTAGQVRPQGQPGGYNPFYAHRGQYPSQGYRGTGATFYQPHHHNPYNAMNNNSGGNYISQQPNIGRGGSGGNLPAYTQQ